MPDQPAAPDAAPRPHPLLARIDWEAAGRETFPIKLIRPRVVLYASAIAVVGALMLTGLMMRSNLDVNVLHDRNPVYVKLSAPKALADGV